MTTTIRITKILMILICSLSILISCRKKEESGQFTVRMTDAPADYVKVNVDIIGMEVNHNTGGWRSVPIRTGIYNLLELQNNVNVILIENYELPAGEIYQMRLVLGANNSLVTVTGTHELKVPSGSESGLKLNLNQTLLPNKTVEILLDFDANASVVEQGNGSYSLKPVLKVKSVNQF